MRMRDKVVVSQDDAEKIEGYFRQVIFELIFLIVDLVMDGICNKFLNTKIFEHENFVNRV